MHYKIVIRLLAAMDGGVPRSVELLQEDLKSFSLDSCGDVDYSFKDPGTGPSTVFIPRYRIDRIEYYDVVE